MNIITRIKSLGDMKKFCWREMLSDNTGKTSASSTMGVLVTVVSTLIFAFASITKNMILVEHATTVIMTGAALLGVNKVMNGKPIVETVTEQPEQTSTEQ